jgi:hypothetical protein
MVLTVQELFHKIKEGESISKVSIRLGIDRSTIGKRLKRIGYKYDNISKSYKYEGEGEEPLEYNLLEDISPNIIQGEFIQDEHEKESRFTQGEFTQDEINMLKEIIVSWKGGGTDNKDDLRDRIEELEKGDRVRDTVVMDKGIWKKVNQYKKRGFNKSDVLHLALIDFFQKYDG